MKNLISIILILSYSINSFAQEEFNKIDSNKCYKKFSDVLRNGELKGHLRSAYFHSDNKAKLSDAYAMGIGMGIEFETGKFKGFQIGLGGFFIYNILSSDLAALDTITKQPNRYEIGLFDIENPKNKHDLDRLEDLYLKYHYKKSFIKIGKQHFDSPFLNAQDGRMRPTIVQGLHFELNEIENAKIQLSYINSISPRSTVKWFGIGESIGVYPSGVSSSGKASKYKGNVGSHFILLSDIQYTYRKNFKIHAHNMYVENVMNTSFFELDFKHKISKSSSLRTSAQWIHQVKIENGGNDSAYKSYYENQEKADALSARIGYIDNKTTIYLSYTRIFDEGKYLMPREWGRDPFYTFMPRERSEGFANLHAINISYKRNWFENKFISGIAFGYYDLPDVLDFSKNKYGLPDYSQLNIDLKYNFKKYFEGLSVDVLYVHKFNNGNTYNNLKYVYNKVDLTLFNIILNYKF